jgi:succinoglycan biosynthesis protein ExoA
MVDVSVLTPVRNEADVIRETVAGITGQRFDGTVEYLLIEGRSDDATRAILDELAADDPRVRVLDNPRGDLAAALAVGLPAARGEFVAKMDAHTYFEPTYLQAGVDRLRRGDVHWVSGPPIPHGIDRGSRRVAIALESWLGVGGSVKWPRSFDGGDAVTELELDTGVFSGVWRRSVLEGLGGWDPAWPANEDAELASRFFAAGERIVCVRAMGARYIPRGTLRGLARQYGRYGYYRIKTARRHPASLRRSHVLPPSVALALAVAVLGGRRGRLLAAPALLVYGAAVALTCVRLRDRAEPADIALLPGVFGAMHLGYGAGMLAGMARFGVPAAALARLAGLPRPSAGDGSGADAG